MMEQFFQLHKLKVKPTDFLIYMDARFLAPIINLFQLYHNTAQ